MQIKDFANQLRNKLNILVNSDSNLQRKEVAEEDRLLRVVTNVSDVAARIVREEKILQSFRATQRLQMRESKG